MSRLQRALVLIAVMFWQSLSWGMPFVVKEQAQRLAHVMVHEEVVDHHHHHHNNDDDSIHVAEADNDAVHLHADGGIQPMGLFVGLNALPTQALPAAQPKTVVRCPPSVCLDGLLRPPQIAT
jgi:hypothetical protein